MSRSINPGIMISQIAPNTREREGETLRMLDHVLREKFFASVQTVEIPFRAERKAFADLIGDEGLAYTYCFARVLNENKWNLSDMNVSNREKSVAAMIDGLHEAKEAGAQSVALISGLRPGNAELRKEALEKLEMSLSDIIREAEKLGGLKVVIEPLDYSAHKKFTLGTTREAVALCQALQSNGLPLYLCLDTAHMLLNGESLKQSMQLGAAYISEFHFCNPVVEPGHPWYGDRHLPFGSPGMLHEGDIGEIMKDALDVRFFDPERKISVMCEVLNRDGEDPLRLIAENRMRLEKAWTAAHASKSGGN